MAQTHEVPSWTAPYRLKVALRLLRARWINFISILGVTLGVASIIVVMSVMDGFQRELREMIRGTLSDLIVRIDDYSVRSCKELREVLEKYGAGDTVRLTYKRGTAIKTGELELARDPKRKESK